MLVTLAGIVIEVKLVAIENASSPMLITLSGIVMDVKPDAYWKALFPMLVNRDPASNVTELKLVAL